jgi:DNA-binding MarR family transcriptional regulator
VVPVASLTDRGLVFSELLAELTRVNGLVRTAGDALARPAGLTDARWQVLRVVDHAPVTVAQAARTMGTTRQTVRETVASLESLGMVGYEDNPRDRRARLVVLTPRGRTALRSVERRRAAWTDQVASRASLSDLRSATGLLRDLGDMLDA